MDTSKQLKPKRGVFRKNKVVRRFAIAGLVFLALTVVFIIAGIIWPEAFYGCRYVPYVPPKCDSATCVIIDLAGSTHCSPFVLGWLTAIMAVCAVECWLVALVWHWLGDKKKKSLRVMKKLLTAISIYEMVVTPIYLFTQTVTTDELITALSDSLGTFVVMASNIISFVALILDVVWLVLMLTTWVLVQIDKKRA